MNRLSPVVLGVVVLLLSACDASVSAPAQRETKLPVNGDKTPSESKPTAATTTETPSVSRTASTTPVTAMVKTDHATIHASESFTLSVEVQIAPGWHIYAIDRPTGPSLPTEIEIKLPKGLRWDGTWSSPEPTVDNSLPGEPSFIHEGTAVFQRRVVATGDSSPGAAILDGTLHYQACNRFSCLIPTQLALHAEIRVVP